MIAVHYVYVKYFIIFVAVLESIKTFNDSGLSADLILSVGVGENLHRSRPLTAFASSHLSSLYDAQHLLGRNITNIKWRVHHKNRVERYIARLYERRRSQYQVGISLFPFCESIIRSVSCQREIEANRHRSVFLVLGHPCVVSVHTEETTDDRLAKHKVTARTK